MVVLCVCATVAGTQAAQVIYVDDDAPGTGNGASWQSACKYLQDALTLAVAAAKPVEIRVAQGVYKPDQGADVTPGDRLASFKLIDGVVLKGGYVGATSQDPNACDPERYVTVLSGDLKGDDVEVAEPNDLRWFASEPTRADNSLHVVIGSGVDETAAIDGFVITAGCAARVPSIAHLGGGMLNESGSPQIVRCRFRDNMSLSAGAAVCNQNGSPTFSNCLFQRNFSTGRAGAMYNSGSSHVVVTGCTFTGQITQSRGGAIVNEENSSLSLKGCVFTNNESWEGGAIYSSPDCPVNLEDCTFEGNRTIRSGDGGAISSLASVTALRCTFRGNFTAGSGGAIHIDGTTLLVSDCSFIGNAIEQGRDGAGGAIYMGWDTMATIENSIFEDNVAPNGGAVFASSGHTRITGCRFRTNSALTSSLPSFFHAGGGAIAGDNAAMKLTDCDFQGNRARDGGAVRGSYFMNLLLTNCILTGNRAERSGGIDMTMGNLRLSNCTLASNFGADGHAMTGPGVLEHCIVWDGGDLYLGDFSGRGTITAVYSDIQGGYPGQGNLDVDPLFVRSGRWTDPNDPNVVLGPEDPNAIWLAGDYRLQSQAGHWDQDANDYVLDGATSPCIDAGDWGTPVGDEPFPNGGILNLGAYGGTPQASRSYFGGPICAAPIAGDINGDCKVDSVDAELALQDWRISGGPIVNQPPKVAITAPADGAVITVSPAKPTIPIVVDASDADGSVKQVSFSIEQKTENYRFRTSTLDNDGSDGWRWDWRFLNGTGDNFGPGQYTITVFAIDDDCDIAFASKVRFTVVVTK
jgi:predicted outer membrane repeat protein